MGKESKRAPKRVADKNAPRFVRTRTDLISNEFVEEFLKEYPQYSEVKNFKNISDTKRLAKRCNASLWQHTVDNRDGIDLPERLGVLFVGGKTSVYTPVDYGNTSKYQTEVLMHNYESNGIIGRIFYSRHSRNHGMTVKTIWTFKPCREYTQGVKTSFKEGNSRRYRRVENKKQLLYLFEERQRARNKKEGYGMLENYNEFE
jgi:hypothetical protein